MDFPDTNEIVENLQDRLNVVTLIRQAVEACEASGSTPHNLASSIDSISAHIISGDGCAMIMRHDDHWHADTEPRVTDLPVGMGLDDAELVGMLAAWLKAAPPRPRSSRKHKKRIIRAFETMKARQSSERVPGDVG